MKRMTAFSLDLADKASPFDRCFNPVGLDGKGAYINRILSPLLGPLNSHPNPPI
jgi:hypothetical protein